MKRIKITISGRVQGVGFRPAIYRYALQEKLKGFVLNTNDGVVVEVEGKNENLNSFLKKIKTQSPKLSRISRISVKEIESKFDKKFIIKKSISNKETSLDISPDISICDDCSKELFDENDRRYMYPFINCTNCGPRFTIINNVPYDRKNTTMQDFRMCKNCKNEYNNPADRRFHAQPDACWDCGPNIELVTSKKLEVKSLSTGNDAIEKTIELLKKGKIIAVKGIGGFHIACDAANEHAVKKLRLRKNRPDKPFAVMMPNIETIKKYCFVSKAEENILKSPERPIVLLKKILRTFKLVAPNNNSLGVMLPYTPLHYLLIQSIDVLVMTSGNKQDEPICRTNNEAIKELSGICDYFLLHNRDIFNRCDDSIVRIHNKNDLVVIRRSRGYVPNPIKMAPRLLGLNGVAGRRRSLKTEQSEKSILSMGAELKNTFCITRGTEAYLSQYVGDLKDSKANRFYIESIENMKNILKVEPKVIAHDLHPDYLSTQYAKDELRTNNYELAFPIQHHHAHVSSVCAENNINEKVIGVSFDGTGYGTDGKIWGGEFLIVDGGTFQRKYHLKYIELPGGDVATTEIWRIGFSYLYSVFGVEAIKFYPNRDAAVIGKMIEKKINCPSTSSVGRLFDAVASIIGIRQEVTFEAQAAIELEYLADKRLDLKSGSYEYEICNENVDTKKMIIGIMNDLISKKTKNEISLKFHNTLAKIISDICRRIRKNLKLNKVILSGGVFQNKILVEKSLKLLKNDGFDVYFNKQVPTNDGGISLGQAWIAKNLINFAEKNKNN